MRFHLTLKLPGRNGSATQFMICDHPASSLEEFNEILNEEDHILVTEINTDRDTRALITGDQASVNQHHVAKATVFMPRRAGHG